MRTTINRHPTFEVVSALQKAIRRGEVENAVHWACELYRSGLEGWLIRRLRIILSEDCAADPHLPASIEALFVSHKELGRKRENDNRLLPLLHIVVLLAQAPKSRVCCWAAVAYTEGDVERRDVPDEALDRHTARGARRGRGWEFFFEDATRLHPHVPQPGEDRYRALAWEALTTPKPADDDGQMELAGEEES